MSGGGQAQFFSCNSDYAACHAYDSEEPKSVLINVDGEEVLSNEYDALYPIGGDMFIAIDSRSYGIIHASGDVVLKCNYDDIFGRLGSKVVVKEDDYWHVVDEDGKTYGDEFKNALMVTDCFCYYLLNTVGRRTEFTVMADFINELVWKNFYSPGGGFSNPSEVAEYIDYGEPSSYMYENDMKAFIDHVVVGGFQTIVTYDFGGKTLVDKTYGDDLLDRHRYQHPHYNWSSDTFLQSIHGEIRLGSSRSYNDVVKYLKAELRCSHFTQEEDGNLYKSIGQGKKLRMSFEKKNGNLTFMMEAITTE